MNNLFSCLETYCFHDTVVTAVSPTDSGLTFFFADGLYRSGTDERTPPATMEIAVIGGFDRAKAWEHVEILQIRRQKIKEIDLAALVSAVQKEGFSLENGYASPFGPAFLLAGYVGKYRILVKITELQAIRIG